MRLFHDEGSAVRKYLLAQAAVAGIFFGFVFGLVGEASRFASSGPLFLFLYLLLFGGCIAYLVFPLASSAYFIKNSRDKWLRLSIFGFLGVGGSVASIFYLLMAIAPLFNPPPFHVSLATAVTIPAAGVILVSPVLYFLGYLKDFMNVNFHLFLVLAMVLMAVPSGFAAANLSDALVEKEGLGVGVITTGTGNLGCARIVETQCVAVGDSNISAPEACIEENSQGLDVFRQQLRESLEADGYSISRGSGNSITIECPDG